MLARTAVRYTGNAKDMAELSAFLGTHAAAEPVPVASDKAAAAKEEEAAAEEKGKKKDKSGVRFDPQKREYQASCIYTHRCTSICKLVVLMYCGVVVGWQPPCRTSWRTASGTPW